MKILDFFLFLWVTFAFQQLKLMRIHADPDTDPDPKPWLSLATRYRIRNCKLSEPCSSGVQRRELVS
jgi:hypothetical protein